MRNIDEQKETNNSSVYKKLRRFEVSNKTGACSYCRPHAGENKRWTKHPVKKAYQLVRNRKRIGNADL